MRKTVFILFVLLFGPQLYAQQQAFKMRLLANYNDSNLPKVDITDIWNDLTGYFEPIKKREYIIAGGTDSIYFFDITGTSEIKLLRSVWGTSRMARNRDFETYKHYVYCVSDQSGTYGSLKVFDLQYLPDSIPLVFESAILGSSTHTIFIDSVSARMYMCSNTKPPGQVSAMDIVSLKNPELPVLLAELKVPTVNGFPLFNMVHEMYARNDTAYLSCGNAGLYIFDLRDTGNQTLLGSINEYPDRGYNHSCWLDKTGRYLMFTDENMGLDVKIFDIKNMADPKFVSQFNSNENAMPHNAYWVGDLAYVSSYHDGVRIYNVKDPGNPIQVAWYDTHPETPEIYGGYKGAWGVYPYLPSKRIIASDLTGGIFVFEVDSDLVGLIQTEKAAEMFNMYPNPSTEWLTVESSFSEQTRLQIMDLQGKVCLILNIEKGLNKIDLCDLTQGTYIVKVQTSNSFVYKKLLRW
ncbi:MAG: choice-of-anchor B family protein [Bacteroidota bacterium]|nr:choice-of-anchor B family protein [Bacteroidota bacterium]